MNPDRLRFEALPKGNGGDDADELYGLRAVNPSVKSGGVPSGAQAGSAAQGDQAVATPDQSMLPRNRALIQRYFDSK